MKWTEEDKEIVRLLSEEGMTALAISNEVGIPKSTITDWRALWGYSSKNSYKHLYKGTVEEVQERLVKIMQSAPEVSYTIFNSKDSTVPSATIYRKYFGSWENALNAAGIVITNVQASSKPTTVYLVEFEGFYKIGITQQTVDQRLGKRYGKYEILLQIVTTHEEAIKLEKQWLNNVKPFKYIPTTFPAEGRGFTECFKV